jgi:hypothetical protein
MQICICVWVRRLYTYLMACSSTSAEFTMQLKIRRHVSPLVFGHINRQQFNGG